MWLHAARALLRSYGAASGHVGPKPFPGAAPRRLRFGHSSIPNTETEVNMAIINLRDYYPFYTSDCFMEVSEEVAEMFYKEDCLHGIFHTQSRTTPMEGLRFF